jgi:N-acyl-D-amino-acid deacylase
MIGHTMIEDDLRVFYAQPWVMVASDGGIANSHPRSAGTFPRVLGRFVREQAWMTWPEAIRKMTALPAPGLKADLVLFDPARIIDRATFEDPGALPEGMRGVWVNGARVWDGAAVTAVRPGRVLVPSPRTRP